MGDFLAWLVCLLIGHKIPHLAPSAGERWVCWYCWREVEWRSSGSQS